MKVYRTKGGYFYKELKNGKKTRISKEQYQKLRKTQKSGTKCRTCGANWLDGDGNTIWVCNDCTKGPETTCYGCGSAGRGKKIWYCRVCNNNFCKDHSTCKPKYVTWKTVKDRKTLFPHNTGEKWAWSNLRPRLGTAEGRYKICESCYDLRAEANAREQRKHKLMTTGTQCSTCRGDGKIGDEDGYSYNPGGVADYWVDGYPIYSNCNKCNGMGYVKK